MNKKHHIQYLLLLFVIINNVLAQNINTIAGNGTAGNLGDGGPAIMAQLQDPAEVAVDAAGNIYIYIYIYIYISSFNCIRKIDLTGNITTIAGSNSGSWGYTGDGGPATTALLHTPGGIITDVAGNIYFTEYKNNCIRKINTSGIISTVAGTGAAGFSGDGGQATLAKLKGPSDVAIDAGGNLYIAEAGGHRIRKVNTTGIISTIAGTGLNSYSGDGGPAVLAELNTPFGIEVDAISNIYISDIHNYRIRKIDNAGIINTFAGTGIAGFSGDGAPAVNAQICSPIGIKVNNNSIYFADGCGYIRKVNSLGNINTIAGIGTNGFSGDGGPSLFAQFNSPRQIAFDSYGNMYIADSGNNRIRKVDLITGINETTVSNNVIIYPNPASQVLSTYSSENKFQNSEIEITNYLGQSVLKQEYSSTINVTNFSLGIYTLKITTSNKQTFFSKFIKE